MLPIGHITANSVRCSNNCNRLDIYVNTRKWYLQILHQLSAQQWVVVDLEMRSTREETLVAVLPALGACLISFRNCEIIKMTGISRQVLLSGIEKSVDWLLMICECDNFITLPGNDDSGRMLSRLQVFCDYMWCTCFLCPRVVWRKELYVSRFLGWVFCRPALTAVSEAWNTKPICLSRSRKRSKSDLFSVCLIHSKAASARAKCWMPSGSSRRLSVIGWKVPVQLGTKPQLQLINLGHWRH